MKKKLIINTKDFGGYKNFHALLKRVKPFIFADESRYSLNGIFFELKNNTTTITATDGHKLYTEVFNVKNETEGNFIFSLKGVKEVLKMKENYVFEVEELRVKILNNEYKWIIDANFAEYEKTIPKNNNFVLSYTKEDLNRKFLLEQNNLIKKHLKSNENIKLMQEYIERKDLLKIDFEKLMQYLTYQENNMLGLITKQEQQTLEKNKKFVRNFIRDENIDISPFETNDKTISFDQCYLRDIMNAIDGDVINFNLLDKRNPAIFYENNKRIVLMPLRF